MAKIKLSDGSIVSIPEGLDPQAELALLRRADPDAFPNEEPSMGTLTWEAAKGFALDAMGLPGTIMRGTAESIGALENVDPTKAPIIKNIMAAGEHWKKGTEIIVPTSTDPAISGHTGVQVGRGLGQLAGQIALGYATGGASLLGASTSIATGMTMSIDEAYQDALSHAATPQQAREAVGWGALAGTTEFLPIMRALNRLGKPVKNRIMAALVEGGVGGLEEGVQEIIQQAILNYGAQSGGWDPDRSITEGLKQSAQVGGMTGAIANFLITAVTGKKSHMTNPEVTKNPEVSPVDPKAPPVSSDVFDPEVIRPEADIPIDPETTVVNPVDEGGEILSEDETMEPPEDFVGPTMPDYMDTEGPGWDAARAGALEEQIAAGSIPDPNVSPEDVSNEAPVAVRDEGNIIRDPAEISRREKLLRDKKPDIAEDSVIPAGKRGTTNLPKVMRTPEGNTIEELFHAQVLNQARTAEGIGEDPQFASDIMQIVRARAESAGESTDQYIFNRGLALNVGGFDSLTGVLRTKDPVSGETKIKDQNSNGTVNATVTYAIKENEEGQEEIYNIIQVFKSQNASSIIHELGHVFSQDLNGPMLAAANKFIDPKASPRTNPLNWTKGVEGKGAELWARTFENYLRTGKAPKSNPELTSVFERLKEAFRRVYKVLRNSPIDYEITPDVKKVFDALLTPNGMPSKLPQHELTYAAWKLKFGEDIAGFYGVSDTSYSVKYRGEGTKLLERIKESIFFSTRVESVARLALMQEKGLLDPTKIDNDSLFFNILQYLAAEANLSFANRASVESQIATVKGPLLSEAKGNSEKTDRAHQLLSYLEEQERYIVIERTTRTPLRESLRALQEAEFARGNTEPLFINRHTGFIFKLVRSNKYGSVLVDMNGLFAVRLRKGRETTDYLSVETVSPKGSFSMTKEDFLLGKHAEMVEQAIEEGKAVPSFVIGVHINRDISFQQAYDFALKQEEEKTQYLAQRKLVQEFKQEQYAEDVPSVQSFTQVSQDTINSYNHPKPLMKRLQTIAGMVDQTFYLLERLSNSLDKSGVFKFTDIVGKADLQTTSRLRGNVGDHTVADYLANIYSELDNIKDALETNNIDLKDNDKVSALYERVRSLYMSIDVWHSRFEDSGNGAMLEPGKTESSVNKIWDWFERSVPIIPEAAGSDTVALAIRKATMTMQWMARRFPVLQPLFKMGSTERFERATLITNSILNGTLEPETVEYIDSKGNAKTKVISQPGLRTFSNIPSHGSTYVALQHILLTGDAIQKRFTDEDLRTILSKSTGVITKDGTVVLSLTEQEAIIKAYNEVQGSLEWMFYKLHQTLQRQFGSTRAQKVMKDLYPKGYIPGYFPHSRTGKHAVAVKDEKGKTVYFSMYDRAIDQKRALARLRTKNPGLTVVAVDPSDKIHYQYGGGVDLITAIKDVIAKADLQATIGDEATASAVEDSIDEATAAIIKSHGMFSMFGERRNVAGFDERILQVMAKRITDFGSAVAKVEFAKNGTLELSKMRATPSLYEYAQDWFGAMLQNADSMDHMTGKIRQLIFLKYLGFSVKTAFVVVADKITNAPSQIGLHTKNAEGKLAKSMKETIKFKNWLRAVDKMANTEGILRDEAAKRIPIPSSFDMETINAMLWSLDSGTSKAKFVPELLDKEETSWEIGNSDRTSKYGRFMDLAGIGMGKVFDAAAWMITEAESFNRLSTFHTAYMVFRKEKRYDFDRAINQASEMVISSHFLYGKANLPNFMHRKGIAKLTKTFYTFRAFEHNYVQMIGDLMFNKGDRGKKMAAKSLAYLMMLGGVPALPFFAAIAKFYGMFTGDDPEEEVLKTLYQKGAPDFIGDLFADGLPALTGTTFRGSLQVGSYDTWTSLFAGVAGSAASDLIESGKAINHGDWDTFVRKALPTFAANLYKAKEGRDHGIVSTYGTPLREGMIGKQIKYTDAETLQKVLSFNPIREARAYRIKKATMVQDQFWGDRRKNIFTKFSKAVRTGDKAGIAAAAHDIVSYEKDRVAKGAVGIPPITQQSLRGSLQESGLARREILQVLQVTGRLSGI